MIGSGLKSLGSWPRWTARNSKPARRRASRGNRCKSSRDDPIQVIGFSLVPTMPDQVYCDAQEPSSYNAESTLPLTFREWANGPAHRELPHRGLSASAEPPPGRAAVARVVSRRSSSHKHALLAFSHQVFQKVAAIAAVFAANCSGLNPQLGGRISIEFARCQRGSIRSRT